MCPTIVLQHNYRYHFTSVVSVIVIINYYYYIIIINYYYCFHYG